MPLREGPRSHAAVKGRHTAADESRHCKGLGRRRQKCAAALMGISAAPSVKCTATSGQQKPCTASMTRSWSLHVMPV